MFVYDNNNTLDFYTTYPRITTFNIKEQDIIVGWVDIIEGPQLQVRIIAHKAYIDNFNILFKYKKDILELLEYETGVYMPFKSGTVSDYPDYWQMDLEFHWQMDIDFHYTY